MTSALQDFQQFVHWLHRPDSGASDDARRFANLVSENFPAVAASSRQRSQRSFVLSELARLSLPATSPAEPVPQAAEARAGWAFRKLHHLTVGPFRGFRQPEPFELQKRIVMFYGPNGSGKTSLCEALEFALLGAVDEGDIKRIAADRYLSNSHEGRFARPVLLATDFDGRQVPVMADADAYRFCFVEKNRIDAFSRIGMAKGLLKASMSSISKATASARRVSMLADFAFSTRCTVRTFRPASSAKVSCDR